MNTSRCVVDTRSLSLSLRDLNRIWFETNFRQALGLLRFLVWRLLCIDEMKAESKLVNRSLASAIVKLLFRSLQLGVLKLKPVSALAG